MVMKTIDALQLRQAFLAGAQKLEAQKEWINELNVFPVPDGDTGTNMSMTIMAAAQAVEEIEQPTFENLAKAMSSGSLRGARGNSGVILSQLLRGFAKEIRKAEQIDVQTLSRAFARGTETAYKAVMKPKEGTILTVSRAIADQAAQAASETSDVEAFLVRVLEQGNDTLRQTPEMLPVLKQANVVDAGGQGLMCFLQGVLDGLTGKTAVLLNNREQEKDKPAPRSGQPPFRDAAAAPAVSQEKSPDDIVFGYCTEFMINLEPQDSSPAGVEDIEQQLKKYLSSIGDSLVVVSDDGIIKIHVHTNDPGLAIQKGLTYGSLSKMKIDNMREEHREHLIKMTPKKRYGFVSVSAGAGLSDIFRGLGADEIIEGGQTMNPSTQDLVQAVERVPADTVFILPNNKNIILAAQQVQYMVKDKTIQVIPSVTIPQGVTALINFSEEASMEENREQMIREMNHVKSGQVTYAVRDTTIDGYPIHEHDIMGLGDKGILAVGTSIETTALKTLEAMANHESELITIYYGSEIQEADAGRLLEKARHKFPGIELELHNGGQPVYYYLMSVE